jgi:hypothetical protein
MLLLHFTLTARDNAPGTAQTNTDEMTVNVSNKGPFVISQNTDNLSWFQGQSIQLIGL